MTEAGTRQPRRAAKAIDGAADSGDTADTADTTDTTDTGETAQPAVETYELARDELAAVVARLESGGLSLDESLTLWERGEHLAAVCARFLDGARQRVETALARAEESD